MRTGERAFSRRRDKTEPSYLTYTHRHTQPLRMESGVEGGQNEGREMGYKVFQQSR